MRDLRALTVFSERLLLRVGLSNSLSEDVVQTAIWNIAQGANSLLKGRHPRPCDVQDHASFIKYLRGTIRSLVDTRRCYLENHYAHIGYDETEQSSLSPETTAQTQVCEVVQFNDLAHELFNRLEERAPTHLHSILKSWHRQRFDCDRIPLNGSHRRLRAELRSLAAAVIAELNQVRSYRSTSQALKRV